MIDKTAALPVTRQCQLLELSRSSVYYERQPVDWVRAVPFGTGFIDYPAFFKGLRDGGFDGTAVFEMCSPLRGGGAMENLDACATTYLKWMQSQSFVAV